MKTCTTKIWEGHWPRVCGKPSKGLNSHGEPRCGIHSDEAYDRREAKRKAATEAERVRAEQYRATYGQHVFLSPEERAIVLALVKEAYSLGSAPEPVLAQLISKLEK